MNSMIELVRDFDRGEIERVNWETYAPTFFELSSEQYGELADRLWRAIVMQSEQQQSLRDERNFRRFSISGFMSVLKGFSRDQLFDFELDRAAEIARISGDQAKQFFSEEWAFVSRAKSREEAYEKSGLMPFLITVDTFNCRVADVTAQGLSLPSHLRAQNNLSFNSASGREKRFKGLALQLMVNFREM